LYQIVKNIEGYFLRRGASPPPMRAPPQKVGARCGSPQPEGRGNKARQLAIARDPWRALSSPPLSKGTFIFHIKKNFFDISPYPFVKKNFLILRYKK